MARAGKFNSVSAAEFYSMKGDYGKALEMLELAYHQKNAFLVSGSLELFPSTREFDLFFQKPQLAELMRIRKEREIKAKEH